MCLQAFGFALVFAGHGSQQHDLVIPETLIGTQAQLQLEGMCQIRFCVCIFLFSIVHAKSQRLPDQSRTSIRLPYSYCLPAEKENEVPSATAN